MPEFPVDAPKAKVLKALGRLGFQLVREAEFVAMIYQNMDGSRTPLTLPNHTRIKGSTLRTVCTQARIPREDFLRAYEQA